MLTIWLNYMVKKKKDKDKGAEARILAAARKVFTTKGMAGARMQDIADEAVDIIIRGVQPILIQLVPPHFICLI